MGYTGWRRPVRKCVECDGEYRSYDRRRKYCSNACRQRAYRKRRRRRRVSDVRDVVAEGVPLRFRFVTAGGCVHCGGFGSSGLEHGLEVARGRVVCMPCIVDFWCHRWSIGDCVGLEGVENVKELLEIAYRYYTMVGLFHV